MTIKFTTSTNICYKTNSSSWHIVRTIRSCIYKLKSINSIIFYYYSKICSNIKITIMIISSTIFIMLIYPFPHSNSSRHESRKFKMNCSMFTTTQMKTCQIYITISVLSKYSFKSVLRIYFTIPKEIISFENSSKKKIISIFIFIFWSRLISNTSTFSYMFKNSIKCITFLFPNFNTRIYNFNHIIYFLRLTKSFPAS